MNAQPTPPRTRLNRQEAAAWCGVSVDTISRAKKAGLLRAKRTSERGGRELFRVADLEAWMDGMEDA